MKKRLYISNDEAGFFDNNKMLCLDNPPMQGDFIVGDIVISSKQQNGIFGWVCVSAGSPGKWEVICDLKIIQEAIDKIEQRQDTIVNGDINTIKNQITQMAMQALTIDKEHKDELKKLNDKVAVNTNNILNINTEIANIKQTAGDLQGSVNQVVTGINAQIQVNAKNIQANSDRITALENKHEETNTRIENIVNEITDIKNMNEQQTTDIQSAYDKIVKIEQDIVKNEENAGGLFEDLSKQVTLNTENITNLQLSFTEIDADLVDINKRIDSVEKSAEDAVIKVGSIESTMEDNSLEIENIKKGLVGALISHGVNANVGMTWKELFELVLGNASGQPGGGINPMPGELVLYKNGAVNEKTEFKNMIIDSRYRLDEYLDLDIDQDGAMLWFGFNGKIDFSKYESAIIEIKNVAEHASSIGISRNSSAEYGYERGISNFNKSFMKGKDEVVIEEGSRVIHTLSFADLYTDNDKEGYFGIYVTRVAGTGGSINDEIIINSITIIPKPLVPCTGLSLNRSELSLNVGGASFTLVPTVLPADCTDEVVWKSTNAAVATVDQNGVVTPKAVGSCNIRVTCGEITMNCAVTVNAAAGSCTGITLKQHPITLKVGQTINTNAVYEILPAGCTDEVKTTFTSVISITNGVIKGEQAGSTTLTISCGNHTASLIITVEDIEAPNMGNGIVLYKDGIIYNNTEFRNLCIATDPGNYGALDEFIYYNLSNTKQHMWFSYDGYIDFSKYERVDVTVYTENSSQQPNLGLGITSKSGQFAHTGGSTWDGTSHTYTTIMTNKTKTTYSLNINYKGSGYLLLWMNNGETNIPGGIYITDIVVYPKETTPVNKPCTGLYFTKSEGLKVTGAETLNLNELLVVQPEGCTDKVTWTTDSNAVAVTDGIVTVLAGGSAKVQARCGGYAATASVEAVVQPTGGIVLYSGRAFDDTEFGDMMLPTAYIDDYNGNLQFDLSTSMCTWGAFCYESRVNFNNYDAIAITIHTENTQQKNTQIMVGRGANPTFMLGFNTGDVSTVTYEEVTYITTSTTIEPATYVFNFADLRKESDDMGYLGIRIKKGDADGKVYISKIVVYRDGEYYPEPIDE